MVSTVRVTLAQLASTRAKEENLRRALQAVEGAGDTDLLVLPEYLMGVENGGKLSPGYVRRLAEPLDGPFASAILDASRERGFAVLFTMYLLEEGHVYNAAVLADRGRVAAVYRKVHLFDAYGYRESSLFAPGPGPVTARLGEFTAGLAVCFDLRFPELFRAEALMGADLFLVPAAWYAGPYKLEQWLTLTTARAHENTAFLVAVGQTGDAFTGHSLVASPMGHILLNLGVGEASATVELDRGAVEEARRKVPVLSLLRRDAYRGAYC